jgi:hypothetical protein
MSAFAEHIREAAERNAAALNRISGVTTPLGSVEPVRGPYRPVEPRSNLIWLCIDLDGTLATAVWTPDNPTSEIGEPIWANVEKLREAVAEGYKVIIHTSRPDTDYENIEGWLNHYEIPFKTIRTGKPLAALYIDDRGRHADHESWIPGGN